MKVSVIFRCIHSGFEFRVVFLVDGLQPRLEALYSLLFTPYQMMGKRDGFMYIPRGQFYESEPRRIPRNFNSFSLIPVSAPIKFTLQTEPNTL